MPKNIKNKGAKHRRNLKAITTRYKDQYLEDMGYESEDGSYEDSCFSDQELKKTIYLSRAGIYKDFTLTRDESLFELSSSREKSYSSDESFSEGELLSEDESLSEYESLSYDGSYSVEYLSEDEYLDSEDEQELGYSQEFNQDSFSQVDTYSDVEQSFDEGSQISIDPPSYEEQWCLSDDEELGYKPQKNIALSEKEQGVDNMSCEDKDLLKSFQGLTLDAYQLSKSRGAKKFNSPRSHKIDKYSLKPNNRR